MGKGPFNPPPGPGSLFVVAQKTKDRDVLKKKVEQLVTQNTQHNDINAVGRMEE